MRIGITYDLRSDYLAAGYSELETAEFDRPDTIDAIDLALRETGHVTDRIGHARQLVARLARGDRWDLVFNICEGLRGAGREAQVPAILDVYEIPYTFSDPCLMSVCLHKELTKLVVRSAGLPTPRSALISDVAEAAAVRLTYPLFAKPVAEGTGKGISPTSRATTPAELAGECGRLLDEYRQPVLVEEYLPGREFTVGILGTAEHAEVLGTLEIVLLDAAEPGAYSYANKERCEELVRYVLVRPEEDSQVREAEQVALDAWRALGCRDGGRIDLRCDAAGQPSFLEANPLAGLHPEHSDLPMLATALGLPYRELIRRIVDSAASRIGPPPSASRGAGLSTLGCG
jgi:D-alanine-D-alanine ligase